MLTLPPIYNYVVGGCKVTCIVTGSRWQQNSYVVTHIVTAKTVVIDPGDNADTIIQQILRDGGNLSRILLTHPHHDHVGAVSQLSGYFSIACELHKQDVRLLVHAPMYALRFANKKIEPVANYLVFDEESKLEEDPRLRIIHTPGHTKGSTCFLFDGFVFTGDTLLNQHVGRTDLPGSSAEEIITSVEKLLHELVDGTMIFPGHGKPWLSHEAKQWWRNIDGRPREQRSFNDNI